MSTTTAPHLSPRPATTGAYSPTGAAYVTPGPVATGHYLDVQPATTATYTTTQQSMVGGTGYNSNYGSTGAGAGAGHGHGHGFPPTTVVLQPIATPQALGMAGWAAATFVFSTYLAEWYGTYGTASTLWPFILAFGGLGQFASAMWAFRSRDTISTVMNTLWGSFWLALGFYWLVATSANTGEATNIYSRIESYGIWQVPLAVFTWSACIASLFRDLSLTAILFLMATGSSLNIIGWFAPSETVVKVASYFWIVASVCMWYRVTGHLLADSRKENMLPMYRQPGLGRKNRNQGPDGDHRTQWVAPYREPGVVQGSEW